MPKKIDPNQIYDANDVAKALGTSRRNVTLMVQAGRLPATMIGNKYMWTGEQVLRSVATVATMKPNNNKA